MTKHCQEFSDEQAMARLFLRAGPDTAPSSDAKERVLARVLADIEQASGSLGQTKRAWPARAWAVKIGSAAAAIVLAGVAVWWLIGGGTPAAPAFAQMIQNVSHASNMSWDHIVRCPGQPEIRTHAIYASNLRVRFEDEDGTIQIGRLAEMKGLKIRPQQKTATVLSYSKKYQGGGQPLEDLKMVDAASARPVGKEIIDGREAAIFQVDSPQEVMRVWIDIKQQLPLRVQITSRDQGTEQTVVTMENMRWNQDIPDSMFSVDIPPGYTKIERPQPSEEYLIKALEICAGLSNGSFPPELESAKFMEFCTAREPEMKHFSPEHMGIPAIFKALDEATGQRVRTCLIGSRFIDDLEEMAQWHYFGSSVKYGDSKAILLAWRRRDAANWRVIFGDLSVKEMSADQLPPMPASSLQGVK